MNPKNYSKSHLIRWLFSIIGLKPKGTKQLLQELKFTIGEQYENYEFDLKDFGSKTINGLTYEIYLFTKGTSQTLFGLPVKSVLLYFNADILSCVEYEFEGNQFNYLVNEIDSYLVIGITHNISKKTVFKLNKEVVLEIIVENKEITILSIQSINYFNLSSS